MKHSTFLKISLNTILLVVCVNFLLACNGNNTTENIEGNTPAENDNATTSTEITCAIINPPLLRDQQGEATFYTVTPQVNCGLPIPENEMIAAINDPQYADASLCGSCLSVTGPNGQVVVKVVDRCPECLAGDLDLSRAAFSQIADPIQGRVNITWQEIPCDTPSPIQYHLKNGSNPQWIAVQIRNHRHRINQLEARNHSNNQYQVIPRKQYNYFVAENGLGTGPFSFRVTDIYGNQIVDSSILLQENLLSNSHAQFPECQ